jgi:hypothetical protein
MKICPPPSCLAKNSGHEFDFPSGTAGPLGRDHVYGHLANFSTMPTIRGLVRITMAACVLKLIAMVGSGFPQVKLFECLPVLWTSQGKP